MILFRFGAYDATRHILVPSYEVNTSEVYEEWKDGFGKTHRDISAESTSGTMNMQFYTAAEFAAFRTALNAVKSDYGYYTVDIWSNNRQELQTGKEMFIEFAPTIRRDTDRKQFESMLVRVRDRYA